MLQISQKKNPKKPGRATEHSPLSKPTIPHFPSLIFQKFFGKNAQNNLGTAGSRFGVWLFFFGISGEDFLAQTPESSGSSREFWLWVFPPAKGKGKRERREKEIPKSRGEGMRSGAGSRPGGLGGGVFLAGIPQIGSQILEFPNFNPISWDSSIWIPNPGISWSFHAWDSPNWIPNPGIPRLDS